MWRRWAPGNPGSQLVGAGHFEVPKLWAIPKRRLKAPPPWRQDIEGIAAFLNRIKPLRRAGTCSEELWQLTCEEGALDSRGLQALTSRFYYEQKRIKSLLIHNVKAQKQGLHVVNLWDAKERPCCIACGKTGFASRQMSWVGLGCRKSQAMPLERLDAILATLKGQLQSSSALSQRLKTLLATLKMM